MDSKTFLEQARQKIWWGVSVGNAAISYASFTRIRQDLRDAPDLLKSICNEQGANNRTLLHNVFFKSERYVGNHFYLLNFHLLVKGLLAVGADPNPREIAYSHPEAPTSNVSLIYLAAKQENVEMVKLLIQYGADWWSLNSNCDSTLLFHQSLVTSSELNENN